jgi:hypothetical protein
MSEGFGLCCVEFQLGVIKSTADTVYPAEGFGPRIYGVRWPNSRLRFGSGFRYPKRVQDPPETQRESISRTRNGNPRTHGLGADASEAAF